MSTDIDKIKSIDIVEWMSKNGYRQGRGRTGKWRSFYSPFSSEKNPSFKVDTNTNRWLDFSAGITKKKSIIDLIMLIENCSFKEACSLLTNDAHLEIRHFKPKKQQSGVLVHSEEDIANTELIDYFTQQRMIDEEVLRQYTKQITVSFPFGKDPEKKYEAIGMKNSMGGWDFRSTFLKMASAPKAFTKIKGTDSDSYLLFEGFCDWLAYATLYNVSTPRYDVYILNGLGQLNVLKPMLENKKGYIFIDNDTPADNAIETMQDLDITDMRYIYWSEKDFNDYLISLS